MKQAEEQQLPCPDKFFQPQIILLYYLLHFTVFFFSLINKKMLVVYWYVHTRYCSKNYSGTLQGHCTWATYTKYNLHVTTTNDLSNDWHGYTISLISTHIVLHLGADHHSTIKAGSFSVSGLE